MRPRIYTRVCLYIRWSVCRSVHWLCLAKTWRFKAYEAFKVYRPMREHVLVYVGRSECDFCHLSDSLSICHHLRTHHCTPAVLVISRTADLRIQPSIVQAWNQSDGLWEKGRAWLTNRWTNVIFPHSTWLCPLPGKMPQTRGDLN